MPSNKPESGTYEQIKCWAFPDFHENKKLLDGKFCHVIEPYDDQKLISVALLRDDEGGFFIKVLNKDGAHIDPQEAGPIGDALMESIKVAMTIRLRQCQFFFAIGDQPMLVDMFNGKDFVSPGMLKDIFGKRVKTQQIVESEDYDLNKSYNAIIKPNIVCYDQQRPVYVKG